MSCNCEEKQTCESLLNVIDSIRGMQMIKPPQSDWVGNDQKLAMPPEPYVDANAVAQHIQGTRRQVLDLTRRGLIPAYPVDPTVRRKQWRYKLSEVDAAIAARLYNRNRQPRDQKGHNNGQG